MKFLMLICEQETGDREESGQPPAATVSEDHMAAVGKWVAEMDARGIRLTGAGLQSARETTSVRVRDGEVLRTDGPFAESKEVIGGFDLLECADLDEAIEVAAQHPSARSARLELRPIWAG